MNLEAALPPTALARARSGSARARGTRLTEAIKLLALLVLLENRPEHPICNLIVRAAHLRYVSRTRGCHTVICKDPPRGEFTYLQWGTLSPSRVCLVPVSLATPVKGLKECM